jgi:hypothetical protein
MKAPKNVKLSLPEAKLMKRGRQTAKTKRHFLERIRNAPDWGTHAIASWTRDELHER